MIFFAWFWREVLTKRWIAKRLLVLGSIQVYWDDQGDELVQKNKVRR
jgi:hypothetical protein